MGVRSIRIWRLGCVLAIIIVCFILVYVQLETQNGHMELTLYSGCSNKNINQLVHTWVINCNKYYKAPNWNEGIKHKEADWCYFTQGNWEQTSNRGQLSHKDGMNHSNSWGERNTSKGKYLGIGDTEHSQYLGVNPTHI